MAGYIFTSAAWPNFGLGLGDDDAALIARRELASRLSLRGVAFMNQSHSANALMVDSNKSIWPADALISTTPGLGLAVLVGDCLPILLQGEGIVAAIHAGRVGLTTGIIENTITAMRKISPGPISAAVGPHICEKCYEVSLQMYVEISTTHPSSATSTARHALNLTAMAQAELSQLGVDGTDVERCTNCDSQNLYFSHRRATQTGRTGRQIGLVWL